MARPRRSSQLSELSTPQVWCHAYGHDWDDPPTVETELMIGDEVQQRQDHVCENGCGCSKGHYVEPATGQRWGYKRTQGDWYGIDGGFTRADFVAEWFRRAEAKPQRITAVQPTPMRRKRRRKALGGDR